MSTATACRIYSREIESTPTLSAKDEWYLAERVAEGDPIARDHMVRANLKLVILIARGFVGKGVPLDDLVAEGNLGLIRAVDGFDPSTGRFATYASYWIKQSIRRLIDNQGSDVRLPGHAIILLRKWRRAKAALAEQFGRPATDDEIAKALRLSLKRAKVVVDALAASAAMKGLGNDHDADSLTLDSPCTRTSDPLDVVADRDAAEVIRRTVARLDAHEARIVTMLYGLDGEPPMTMSQVGAIVGLSKQRVERIKADALVRMMAMLDPDDD